MIQRQIRFRPQKLRAIFDRRVKTVNLEFSRDSLAGAMMSDFPTTAK